MIRSTHKSSGFYDPAWLGFATLTACQSAMDDSPLNVGAAQLIDDRPNIVFNLADTHQYQAFDSITPGLKTPTLDTLIKAGVWFESTSVTTPFYSPSRTSIQYSQRRRSYGLVDKYEHVFEDSPTQSDPLTALTPAIRTIIDGTGKP